jgi:hypothetical protein
MAERAQARAAESPGLEHVMPRRVVGAPQIVVVVDG